jgi:FtsP/CotA-like multicopper oxidase with cupredoxin domain
MFLSRRDFVLGASALGALSLRIGRSGAAEQQGNPLRIPPLLDGRSAGAEKLYDLNIAAGVSNFLPGLSTPTIGINGPYLGPTIRCRAGDRVKFRVKNGLREPTTLHWHGFHIPARFDGGPHQVIAPAQVWEPHFEVKQKASLFWYHAHMVEQTGEQVVRGLAGLLLVEDDESRALRLPSDYGVDDIPLVIQDRRFSGDGSFEYMSTMGDAEIGYEGDVILVNGTVDPYLLVRRQRTRLRILNGSNSRIYLLGRDDGGDLIVIGADGSLLERPVRLRRVRLAPAERIDLLVEMRSDQTLTLMSYPLVAGATAMAMRGARDDSGAFPILSLRAEKPEPADASMPERLIRVPSWSPAQAARTRTFTLDMTTMSLRRRPLPDMEGPMGINGRSMDMNRIDVRVPLGSVEIWQIENTTTLPHPFHIHDIQFRVLDRDGAPPQPYEQGLKDTVLVESGSKVRVIAEFADFADPAHPYMFHCHNLEHEDAGMMGQFVVV